jgi:multidrug efflux pump subunit AcrB/outer membrane protein TolC
MPRREDPKLTVPSGLVIVYYPGATAAQVEEQVTKKLEQYLFQYEEVLKAKTYSTTRDGVVVVNVWLNNNVKKPDIFWNKLRHQLLVSKQIDLPQGVVGPIVNSDFGDTEAMLISIESSDATYTELNEYAKRLEDNIRLVNSTSKIKRIGEQKEQVTVYFNPDKLSQLGISMQQIVKVLQSQNTVSPTGEVKTGNNAVALYTSGYYTNISEIENQVVGTSKTGDVVHLSDIATLKREYAEPTTAINVNGHKAIIVSVQMNEGNNIVMFGNDVNKKIDEVSKQLPSNVKMTTIVNQPRMVKDNVSHFLLEFLIAIITVIIIIILLLPFRVAAVAATAIPMTIAVTFAILHLFGMELHQVSLASLIVVLGMVVDDAIVVTDNYVELLDRGVDRWSAAWRSATELVIPILTATITIIAAFIPMLVISGAIGEFIQALPVTVTIALASSFVVAMVLTPTLCFFFIKKGLHDPTQQNAEKKKSGKKSLVLDSMQKGYDKAIDWCASHHTITITASLLLIVAAGVLFKFGVRQKFMPYAERNQFVVELWMPTGTQLEKTKDAITRIENEIKNDKRLVSYASFSGTSAPRVYYNFSPEFPVSNYAQLLINTNSDKETETFAQELSKKVDALVPEGTVQVKLMQQGQPLPAPIEVRVYGDDVQKLKEIGNQVKTILRSKKGNYLVSDDFHEDFYGVSIQLKDDAERLGFSTTSVSQMVYTAFKGYTVSTMYEGDKPVDIVLRMDSDKRESTQDLENFYLESPVTGAKVPLRQIAEIKPEWQPGRIMHRNGIRCLTVRSESKEDVLPSELLSQIRPEIAKLNLPNGYRIEYGGEYANQKEVIMQLVTALGMSLVLIFLVLLLQFRNLKETFIIMLTIPLSLFGAILGLWITGNNFGFTAFVGIISLSGIVVRNAIILIEHTNELIEKGRDIREAVVEAGKRRLRPIFLTAMAAALGVLPMILSGSSLWSPLASVIAFGVVWSMVMALLTVPVLYMIMIKPKDKIHQMEKAAKSAQGNKTSVIVSAIALLMMISPGLKAQNTEKKLNLQQIQELAVNNNRYLKIKQLQVNEKEQKVNEDKVKFFPNVSVGANYQYNTNLPELTIDAGSFGTLPLLVQLPDGNLTTVDVSLPANDKVFKMGEHNTYNASATLYQPISQLPKIAKGVNISKAELAITKAEQGKVTMQIKQAAEKLYYGLLILQKQKEEAEIKILLAKSKLKDVESAVIAGKTIYSSQAGLNAQLADEEQNLLKIKIQTDDYISDLKQLIGMDESEVFTLETITVDEIENSTLPIDSITTLVLADNLDLKIAGLTATKAKNAVDATRLSYLPDLGVFGVYTYQKGNTLYPENNALVGVSFKWNIQDIVSNTFTKNQRNLQKKQADESYINTKEQVNNDLYKAYRRVNQSLELISVARKVLDYRREDMKTQIDKQLSGLNIESDYLTTKSAYAKAEADYLAAKLNYRLALTDLQILTGKY